MANFENYGEKRHHLFSLTLPVSITNTTSGMVMPVSAMLVASTIFLVPAGGTVNAWLWSAELSTECNATTLYLYKRSKKQCKYDVHTDIQSYCHFWCYLFLRYEDTYVASRGWKYKVSPISTRLWRDVRIPVP